MIKKITAYSIPVEKVELLDSVPFTGYIYPGNPNRKVGGVLGYTGTEFKFNRLPRNVAELKTLMENPDGSRVEATNNPLFIAAVMYLVIPRLLDCSQDCRDMIDYLYGTQYDALNTYGVSNTEFQNFATSMFGGRDGAGFWTGHESLREGRLVITVSCHLVETAEEIVKHCSHRVVHTELLLYDIAVRFRP